MKVKRPIQMAYMTYKCPDCGQAIHTAPGDIEHCPHCGAFLHWGQECRTCVHSEYKDYQGWFCKITSSAISYADTCPAWQTKYIYNAIPYALRTYFCCSVCGNKVGRLFQQKKVCKFCGVVLDWKHQCDNCTHLKHDYEVLVCELTGNCMCSSETCDNWSVCIPEVEDDNG